MFKLLVFTYVARKTETNMCKFPFFFLSCSFATFNDVTSKAVRRTTFFSFEVNFCTATPPPRCKKTVWKTDISDKLQYLIFHHVCMQMFNLDYNDAPSISYLVKAWIFILWTHKFRRGPSGYLYPSLWDRISVSMNTAVLPVGESENVGNHCFK
jgi:hypothetical protein